MIYVLIDLHGTKMPPSIPHESAKDTSILSKTHFQYIHVPMHHTMTHNIENALDNETIKYRDDMQVSSKRPCLDKHVV